MEKDTSAELLIRLEALQQRTDQLYEESKESISDLKNDMMYRFDTLQKSLSGVSQKVENESRINAEQTVKIEGLLKKVHTIEYSGNDRIGALERADVRNKIIGSIMGFVGVTFGGIIIKLLVDKII